MGFDIVAYNASLTPEQRRENASKAGKASAEAKRQYRTMRDCLKAIATLDVNDREMHKLLTSLGLQPTMQNAANLSAFLKACDGDIEAFRTIRDTIGEKPTTEYNASIALSGRPLDSLNLSSMTDAELQAIADN